MKTLLRIIIYKIFPKLTQGACVLMYHSIDTNQAFFNVTPDNFEKQMKYIHERGFRVVPLSVLVKMYSEGKDLSGLVSITFDDGYRSVLENALPVLKKYNLSATLFIAPGLLGTSFTTSDHTTLEIMTKDEYDQILRSGTFECLSHAMSHRELPRISLGDVQKELANSYAFFGDQTPKILAYPRGKYSDEVFQVLEKEGWTAAVTTNPGLFNSSTSKFLIPRNFVGRDTSLSEFKTLLSDGVYYYAKLRAFFVVFKKKF